jgi:hypothetical protein
MKANLKNTLIVVCWVFSFIPIAAFGLDISSEECFRASPTVQKGENLYAYPKIRKLNEKEYTAVQKMLETLVGQWQGSMDEINCHGSEHSSSKEIDHYSVKAKALLSREGDFSIRADLHCKEKKTGSQQVHNLSFKEKILLWGGDIGFVEPISLSAGQLSFLYKKGAYGVLREMFITIEGDSNMLVIDEEIYAWGKLSGRKYWHLSR